MFTDRYGFTMNSFDKQSLRVEDAFLSTDHKETIGRLNHLVDGRGIGIFTAAPGLGKTFAIRCFAKTLNPRLHRLLYVCMSTVSVMDFYRQFCMILNIETSYKKSSMFKAIQDRLLANHRDQHIPYIIVIDEAHHLQTDILIDLKLLMNFQYDSLNPFSLVLVGEPYLNRNLDKGVHEALRQRIMVHYDFTGLTGNEVEEYLRHKFITSNASFDILGEGVVTAIASCSNGNPRMIDNLMTQALTIGAQKKLQVIDTDVIYSASNSLVL